MDFHSRIVVEGNDGVGKSTLVESMQCVGFTNVLDRGEMTQATLDSSVQPVPGTIYILLVCDWKRSWCRLSAAKKDMTEHWHTEDSLKLYDAKFRALVPQFQPIVIDTNECDIETLLPMVITRLMDTHPGPQVRVGVASGRLEGLVHNPKFKAPFPFNTTLSDRKTLTCKYSPLLLVSTRNKSYPQMVALDTLDTAIVGSDALEGNPYASQVEVVRSWPQKGKWGDSVVVVLASQCKNHLPQVSPMLRVATPFPEWAQKFLGERGIRHTIFPVSGGSETLVAAGIADALFDVVETGNSLKASGLFVNEVVGNLDLMVIRKRRA